MNSKRWQDHFEDAARAAELTVPATPGANPLVSILEQGIISEDAYLAWAQEAFELPILKNAFFKDHAADPQFWDKWRAQFAWQVDCVPVCEWDGTLFVACLEPREFAADMKVVCLLTGIQCLQNRWAQYQATAPTATELNLEDTITGTPITAAADHAADPEAPEGIVALNSTSPAQLDSASFDSLELESKNASAEIPTGLENLQREVKAVPQHVEVVKPVTVLTKTAPPSNSIFFIENSLKKTPDLIQFSQVFQSMKTHFEKAILLAVDTTERHAKPIAWDQGFTAPDIVSEIPLTTPSIFRIASSTQRPYHGAIVQNEINDQFFADWNKAKIPDHVTIVPIVIQEHVVGLLMGFAGTEAFNRTTLQFVEELVADITGKLDVAAKQAA